MFPIKLCSILTTNPNLVLRLFITLFNLQGARRLAQLGYLTTSQNLCQELFSSFFELFQALSFRDSIQLYRASLRLARRSRRATFVVYHLPSGLSRTFFRFFNLFSSSFVQAVCSGALSQALGYLNTLCRHCQHFSTGNFVQTKEQKHPLV